MHSDCCEECGFDFAEDREGLVARCERFPATLRDLLMSTESDILRRRPAPDIWSPQEYGAHLGEAVLWYVARIRRILGEELPKLEPFDWDLAADTREYQRRSVEAVLADAHRACSSLATIARSLSEEQLLRQGEGSRGSPRSVETLLARAGHELAHHELDLRRGIAMPAQ